MRSEELDALALAQGGPAAGVVTAARLRLAGATPDAVACALGDRWQAPVRGIYVPHRRELTLIEQAHVAVAHAGPGAVLTGALAAQYWRLRWVPQLPGAMVLVAAEVRRRGSEGQVLVRRCAQLPSMPTVQWEGLRVAPVPQVVVDTCRHLLAVRAAASGSPPALVRRAAYEQQCLRDVRGVVLGAIADRRCTVDEVVAVLDAGAVRDTALIRRACRDATRGAASPPEAELIDGLLEHGVFFASNVEMWDGTTLIAVLDAYLLGTGIGAEIDSVEAHGAADALDATLLRHGAVERYGMELRHVTPWRYRAAPEAFHEELFAAARARLAAGLGDPPGVRLVPRGPVLRGPRRADPPYRLPMPPR